MALFGVIGCLMFITCFATTKERVQPIKEQNLNIARDVKILFRNDQWRILSVYNFMMLVAVVIRGGAVVYYVNSVLHKGADVITIFMLGGMFASMLGSGAGQALWDALFVRSDSLSGLIFSPPRWAWSALSSRYNIGLRCSACIFLFLSFRGGNGALQWSMITDVNNYGEWKTQRRITGMNVAANIFVISWASPSAGPSLGWILAYFHYAANTTVQSASAVQGVVLLFTLVPSVFYSAYRRLD